MLVLLCPFLGDAQSSLFAQSSLWGCVLKLPEIGQLAGKLVEGQTAR